MASAFTHLASRRAKSPHIPVHYTPYTAGRWPVYFRQKAMGDFGGGFCNVLIFMASCFLLLLQGVVRK
jgi:hypothetical protein